MLATFVKKIELKKGRLYSFENEFYRIELNGVDITGIFDIDLNEYVSEKRQPLTHDVYSSGLHSNDITVEEDIGSPWETLMNPIFRESLSKPYIILNQLPPDYYVNATIEYSENQIKLIREGAYRNKPRSIEKIVWRQEVVLYKNVDMVNFRTEIDWEAERTMIRLSFPLPFRTKNDEAYYEIPYGVIKREAYIPTTGGYTCANGDWPALNYVACFNIEKNYTVALLNKGIPGCCVRDGVITLSVLRSPQEYFCAFNFEGANDAGKHVFEYSLVSHEGDLKDGDIARKSREFNGAFMNCEAREKTGKLPEIFSFLRNDSNNIQISSIKRAIDDEGIILRAYETYGLPSSDSIDYYDRANMPVTECDLLENEIENDEKTRLTYKPFEIKTLRLIISQTYI